MDVDENQNLREFTQKIIEKVWENKKYYDSDMVKTTDGENLNRIHTTTFILTLMVKKRVFKIFFSSMFHVIL